MRLLAFLAACLFLPSCLEDKAIQVVGEGPTDRADQTPQGDGDQSAPDEGAAGSGALSESQYCEEVGGLAAMDSDPDEGFVDISEYCLELINGYRAEEGLEPYVLHEEGICCSALEARQAVADDTAHNGDFCNWQAQGACGGGRNPNGTVTKSVEWCPRLFYGEGPEGGHYQGMMQEEPRAVACGYYARDRDKHSILVNYWDL